MPDPEGLFTPEELEKFRRAQSASRQRAILTPFRLARELAEPILDPVIRALISIAEQGGSRFLLAPAEAGFRESQDIFRSLTSPESSLAQRGLGVLRLFGGPIIAAGGEGVRQIGRAAQGPLEATGAFSPEQLQAGQEAARLVGEIGTGLGLGLIPTRPPLTGPRPPSAFFTGGRPTGPGVPPLREGPPVGVTSGGQTVRQVIPPEPIGVPAPGGPTPSSATLAALAPSSVEAAKLLHRLERAGPGAAGELSRAASRAFIPLIDRMRQLGPAGNRVADLYEHAYFRTTTNAGAATANFVSQVRSLTKAELSTFKDVFDNIRPATSPRQQQAVESARLIMEDMNQRLSSVVGRQYRPSPGFPTEPDPNYARRLLNPTSVEFREAEKRLLERGYLLDRVTPVILQEASSAVSPFPRFAPRSRVAADVFGPHVITDPEVVISSLALRSERVINRVRAFGANDELFLSAPTKEAPKGGFQWQIGQSVVEEARRAGMDNSTAAALGKRAHDQAGVVFRAMFGNAYEHSAADFSDAVGAIGSIQAMRKMVLSWIPNLSQSAFTAMRAGIWNTFRASFAVPQEIANSLPLVGKHLRERFGDPYALQLAREMGVIMDQSIRQMMLERGLLYAGGGLVSKINSLVLKPFEIVEMYVNRTIAARAGQLWASSLSDKLAAGQALRSGEVSYLNRIGVKPVVGQELSPDQKLKVAFGVVDTTQFLPRPSALPEFWQHPIGRLVFQFKTFSLRATQELWKTVKDGDPVVLARLATVFPTVGVVFDAMSDIARGRDPSAVKNARNLLNALGYRPGTRAEPIEEVAARAIETAVLPILTVGAGGIAADYLQSLMFLPFFPEGAAGLIGGPAVGDLGTFLLATGELGRSGLTKFDQGNMRLREKGFEHLSRLLLPVVPLVDSRTRRDFAKHLAGWSIKAQTIGAEDILQTAPFSRFGIPLEPRR